MTGPELVIALDSINYEIDNYITNDIDIAIYQRTGTGYNDTYDRMLSRYGDLNDYYRREANLDVFGRWDFKDRTEELREMKQSLPNPDQVYVSQCASPHGDCYGYYTDANTHKNTCIGCSDDWWICHDEDKEEHIKRYCDRDIVYTDGTFFLTTISFGKCGAEYRWCDDPLKKSIHNYVNDYGWGQNSWGFWGYYAQGITGSLTAHGYGKTQPLSVSVNGPNGVGISESDYDETPNCDSCIDGSSFCPDSSTQHQ